MKRKHTKGAHTPASQARIRNMDISISCERAVEAGDAAPLSACTAEGAYRSPAKAMGSSTALWARLGGFERWVGYDHDERVGRAPRDDEIQEP